MTQLFTIGLGIWLMGKAPPIPAQVAGWLCVIGATCVILSAILPL
jgi:hypothetical protein